METNGSSGATSTEPTRELSRAELVAAPKDYFLGPVFAATKQTGPREVTIGDRRYQVGGFHPIMRNLSPPALDVRHARAIFALLSFRDPFADDETRLIRFSFNEFCRRYANSNGGRYSRAIAEIVHDLMDSYIRVTDLKTGKAHSYRLIERVDIEDRPIRRKDADLAKSPHQLEMWFNGCTLSPEFAGLLNRISELQHLKLKVFTAIRSPLAQSIYLYIPSRAYHHDEANPFEINLSTLLQQVSFPIPHHKSKRKELFTKHHEEGRSIFQQLDGIETLSGKFRVALAETADGAEWKLQAWVEKQLKKSKPTSDNSKIFAAYLKSGRPRELFDLALSSIPELTGYETDLLETAKIKLDGSRRFFEMAKALLKEARFHNLLSEAKGDALEGRKVTKNPTARLIDRIMKAISAPIQLPGNAK